MTFGQQVVVEVDQAQHQEGGDEGHGHEGPGRDRPSRPGRGTERRSRPRPAGTAGRWARGTTGSGRAATSQLSTGTLSKGRTRAPTRWDNARAGSPPTGAAGCGGCRRWRSCRRRGRGAGRRPAGEGLGQDRGPGSSPLRARSSRSPPLASRLRGGARVLPRGLYDHRDAGAARPRDLPHPVAGRRGLVSVLVLGFSVSLLFVGFLLASTEGHFVPPVVDLYVVCQYARAMAEGHPFQYNRGRAGVHGRHQPAPHRRCSPSATPLGARGEGLVAFAIVLGSRLLPRHDRARPAHRGRRRGRSGGDPGRGSRRPERAGGLGLPLRVRHRRSSCSSRRSCSSSGCSSAHGPRGEGGVALRRSAPGPGPPRGPAHRALPRPCAWAPGAAGAATACWPLWPPRVRPGVLGLYKARHRLLARDLGRRQVALRELRPRRPGSRSWPSTGST